MGGGDNLTTPPSPGAPSHPQPGSCVLVCGGESLSLIHQLYAGLLQQLQSVQQFWQPCVHKAREPWADTVLPASSGHPYCHFVFDRLEGIMDQMSMSLSLVPPPSLSQWPDVHPCDATRIALGRFLVVSRLFFPLWVRVSIIWCWCLPLSPAWGLFPANSIFMGDTHPVPRSFVSRRQPECNYPHHLLPPCSFVFAFAPPIPFQQLPTSPCWCTR